MKKLFISLIVTTFFINGLNAQSISNYAFSTSQLAILENMSVGTAQLIGASSQNMSSGVTDIGFVFNFMGIPYTQFSVNSNGQLKLGGSSISGTGISDALPDQPLLVPVSGGNSILATGKVHFKVTGTSPNRICIVEWKDLNIPYPIVDNNPPIIEFNPTQIQVYLYETSGLIEYKYGSIFNNSVPTVARATFISSSNTGNTVKYIGSDLISVVDAYPVITYPMDASNTAKLNQRYYSFSPVLPPSPTVTVTNNCDGSSTLTASDYTGSLLWSTSETTATITVTVGGNYTVTQTVNGFTSLPAAGFASPKNTPAEPASVTIVPDINNVCAGTSVTFTPTPVNGGSMPTYQWFKNSVAVSTSSTYTFLPVNGDIVSAIMTSDLPCVTGNPVTSNEVTMIVNSSVFNAGTINGSSTFNKGSVGVPYSIEAFANALSYTWSFSGTGVTIHGNGNNVTLDFDTNATAGQLSVKVLNSCGEGLPATLDITEFIPDKTLAISSVLLEGLYNGNGTMRQAYNASGPNWPSGVADHITVELHDINSYSTIVYSINDVALSTTGDVLVNIPAIYNGLYYITIKHRNSIETTSATSVSFAGNSISLSFGDPTGVYLGNLGLSYDNFHFIYGGDVNQDQIIDTRDYTGVDNDSYNFRNGYLPTDVDGNGVVDSRDYIIINNNNYIFVISEHPN